jgi:serine protease Do
MLDYEASSAKIREVMPGLGAEKAGLKPGDVLLQVNAQPVKNSKELTGTLRQFREGQTVTLRARREDQEFDASVQMMIPKLELTWRGSDRQERMNRLGGDVSQRAEGFGLAIQHDTVLQPWQCGGPLLNLDRKAIGLNIARAGRVASYALPAALVKQLIEDLKPRTQIPVNHQDMRATPQ